MFRCEDPRIADQVLHRFGLPGRVELHPLGDRAGFSGACVWQVESLRGRLCLKAWPPGESAPELQRIHDCMRAAAHLDFVPAVHCTPTGASWVTHAGRSWDLTTWLPGRADFRERPEPGRLAAACTALAQLHHALAPRSAAPRPCAGVQRRLRQIADWQAWLRHGWRPAFKPVPAAVRPLAEQAWGLVRDRLARLPPLLTPWAARLLPAQPCLCDIWHDHVLFVGDRVSGLIDYGGVKVDHVAVDLARLLGSMAGTDRCLWTAGLEAYGRLRPLTTQEQALVHVLDVTGTVLGAATWIRWLVREGRSFANWQAVAGRLQALLDRQDVWDNLSRPVL